MSKEDLNKRVNDAAKLLRSVESVAQQNREILTPKAFANIQVFLRGQLEIMLSNTGRLVIDKALTPVGEFSIDREIAAEEQKVKVTYQTEPSLRLKPKTNQKFEGFIAKASPDRTNLPPVAMDFGDEEDDELVERPTVKLPKNSLIDMPGIVDFIED